MTAPCRLTNDWIPLPPAVLAAIGWGEGDLLTLEVVDGALLVTRHSPASALTPPKMPAPPPRRRAI